MSFNYPKSVRFRCERCTLCCGDTERKARRILLLSSEATQISEKVSLPIDQFAVEVDGFKPYAYAMKKTDKGTCVFLGDKLCSIYKIRPLICRFYPFRLRDLGDNRYVFGCTRECPGLGKGPLLERLFFERIFRDFLDSMRRDLARNRMRSAARG